MLHPTAILLDVDEQRLSAWLHSLVALAANEQLLNPLRPQCPPLSVCRVEPHYLPLFVRHPEASYWGLYTQPPGPSAPFGRPLLLAAGRLQASGRLHILVYRYPEFPLEADEVLWLMEQSFPRVFRRWSVLLDMDLPGPEGQMPTSAADAGDVGDLEPVQAPDNMPAPRRAGAPSLECNRWLKEQIAQLPNPLCYHPLMAEWLHRYQVERGRAPVDKRGSFRAAAKSALIDLRRRNAGRET